MSLNSNRILQVREQTDIMCFIPPATGSDGPLRKKKKNFTSLEKCSFKSLSWMTECWAIYMISCMHTCAHTHSVQIFSPGFPSVLPNNKVWRIKVLLLFATGAQTFIHFVSICCHTLLPLWRINKGHYWCPQSSLCSLAIYLGLLGIPGGGGVGGGRGDTIWRQFFMCHFGMFFRAARRKNRETDKLSYN